MAPRNAVTAAACPSSAVTAVGSRPTAMSAAAQATLASLTRTTRGGHGWKKIRLEMLYLHDVLSGSPVSGSLCRYRP